MGKYQPIVRTSLYDAVADQLEEMILNESLKVGEKLPSEQSLAEQFGVSRNILREALKTLGGRGLISVRSGDGVYVTKPESETLSVMLNRFVVLNEVDMAYVYELRSVLEVSGCGLAAERATAEDIAQLEQTANNMELFIGNQEKWVQRELHFHLSIAKASRNPIYYSLISSLTSLLSDIFAKGFQKPNAYKEGIGGHHSIVQAIKSGNRKTAEKEMLRHLEHSREIVMNGQVPS